MFRCDSNSKSVLDLQVYLLFVVKVGYSFCAGVTPGNWGGIGSGLKKFYEMNDVQKGIQDSHY
jgi:hypothetical protein